MTIEITSKFNVEEVCHEFGIPIDQFLQLLSNTHGKDEPTIVFVLDQYLEELEVSCKSLTTKSYYENFLMNFRDFIVSAYPELSISSLNDNILTKYISFRNEKRKIKKASNTMLSTGTKITYQGILKSVISFAKEKNIISNHFRKRFNNEKTVLIPRYILKADINSFLKLSLKRTHGYRCHAMISFLLGTGCRVSELVNLRVKDFDIETGFISVVGKGKKVRTIPIYPNVKDVILDYLSITGVQNWNRKINGYLFSPEYGTKRERKYNVRTVQYMIEKINEEIGSDYHYTVHSFRHTFAVYCLKAGMPLHLLSQVLGHSDPATTSIYVKMFPFDLKNELMEKFPFPFENLLGTIIYESEE